MSTIDRKDLDHRSGKGGFKCPCCGPPKRKDRQRLVRATRRTRKVKAICYSLKEIEGMIKQADKALDGDSSDKEHDALHDIRQGLDAGVRVTIEEEVHYGPDGRVVAVNRLKPPVGG